VAQNLIEDLDVNWAGAAIIVRLRETLLSHRHTLERLLEERDAGAPRSAKGSPDSSE
jgi:hypothetical protein